MAHQSDEDRPKQAQGNAAEEIRLEDEDLGVPDNEVDSQHGSAEPETKKAKKRALPPSRIAFLVFVAAAAVVIVVELWARWGYSRTVKGLDQTYEAAQQKGTGLYREDLEKLLCGSPGREYDQQKQQEIFTWRGIRTHRLQVLYDEGEFVASYRTLGGKE